VANSDAPFPEAVVTTPGGKDIGEVEEW